MPNDPRDNEAARTDKPETPEPTPEPTSASRVVAGEENAREEKWSQPWMAAAIEAMRGVATISGAARAAGVDRRTIQRTVQKDERFALAISAARDDALDTIESTLLLRARSGQPVKKTVTKTLANGDVETIVTEDAIISDSAAFFILKRWRNEYRDTYRVEQSGTLTVKFDGEKVNDDIRRLLAELES